MLWILLMTWTQRVREFGECVFGAKSSLLDETLGCKERRSLAIWLCFCVAATLTLTLTLHTLFIIFAPWRCQARLFCHADEALFHILLHLLLFCHVHALSVAPPPPQQQQGLSHPAGPSPQWGSSRVKPRLPGSLLIGLLCPGSG